MSFYDIEWNKADFSRLDYPQLEFKVEKPNMLKEMLSICKKLSRNFYFGRVDLYEIKNRIYFGEVSFFSGGEMIPFSPIEYDKIIGNYLKLPTSKDGKISD